MAIHDHEQPPERRPQITPDESGHLVLSIPRNDEPIPLPPHSIESERCLLGSCMLDYATMRSLRMLVIPSDFFQPDHQIIWAALCKMTDQSLPVDAVTLAEALKIEGKLDEIGGIEHIGKIISSVPSFHNASSYAGAVLRYSHLREIMQIGKQIYSEASDGRKSMNEIAELLGDLRSRIDLLAARLA